MCKYRPVSLIVIIFALRVDGGAIPSGPASKLASSQEIPGESDLKDVSEDQQPLPEPAQKAAGDASNLGIPAGLSAIPEAAVGRNGNAATNTRIQDTVNRPVPEIGKNVKMSHSNALAVQVDNSARNREQLHKNAAVKDAFRNQNVQHSATSPAKTQTSVGTVEQGHISSFSVGRPAEAPLQNQQSSSWKKQMPKQIDRSDGRALETPSELHSPIHSAMGASSGTKDQSVRADVKAIVNRTRASNASVSQNRAAAKTSSSTPARPVVTEVSTTASTKATTVPQIYDADGDKKAEKVPEIPVPEPVPADESGEVKSGPAVKKQEDGDSAGESDRRTVPTQWPPQYSSGESRPWAQKPPETAPVGPYPTTGEEDSHFFAYFLAATVVCIVAYLAFHNKRKIMALVIEGRAGRQRRQTVAYRRLDTAEKDDVKGRAIF